MMRFRWASSIGMTLRRMGPIVFPGVPAAALMGFTAIGTSPWKNATDEEAGQHFHQIGIFQVEAGPRGGPAPHPDPTAEYNHWGALHDSELVRDLLGRPATVAPNIWKTAIADQIAVGLLNLRRHSRGVAPMLSERIRPRSEDSEWFVRVMFTAFSRGWRHAARILNFYAAELENVPEPIRWRALRARIVDDVKAGLSLGGKMGRSGPAYALVRTDQKMRAGYLLASMVGEDLSWWTSEYLSGEEDIEDGLARTAYGFPLPIDDFGGQGRAW